MANAPRRAPRSSPRCGEFGVGQGRRPDLQPVARPGRLRAAQGAVPGVPTCSTSRLRDAAARGRGGHRARPTAGANVVRGPRPADRRSRKGQPRRLCRRLPGRAHPRRGLCRGGRHGSAACSTSATAAQAQGETYFRAPMRRSTRARANQAMPRAAGRSAAVAAAAVGSSRARPDPDVFGAGGLRADPDITRAPWPSVTVAALQLALELRATRRDNIAAVSALVEQAARRRARRSSCRPNCSPAAISAASRTRRCSRSPGRLAEHPSVIAMQRAGRHAQGRDPDQLLRARRAPLLQHAGDDRRRRRDPGHLPQEPHPRRARATRRSTISAPATTGSRCGTCSAPRIGVGICWDQWYPECARVMALMGAEVLFYPTAIGSEPYDADFDTSRMWRRAMLGHAVSNCMPVIAANRIGASEDGAQRSTATASSPTNGAISLAEFGASETGVLVATLDLDRAARHRAGMGFFRDRRPAALRRGSARTSELGGAALPDRARLQHAPPALSARPRAVLRAALARAATARAGARGASSPIIAQRAARPVAAALRQCRRDRVAPSWTRRRCSRGSAHRTPLRPPPRAASAGARGCSISTSCCGAAAPGKRPA